LEISVCSVCAGAVWPVTRHTAPAHTLQTEIPNYHRTTILTKCFN
jgi:hypothetical protein